MKKPNITPGPWAHGPAMERADCGFRIHTPESAAYGMAHVYSPGPNAEANAQAIAAVPDLLEALERALSIIEDLPYPQDYAAKDLRAALTKAGYTF